LGETDRLSFSDHVLDHDDAISPWGNRSSGHDLECFPLAQWETPSFPGAYLANHLQEKVLGGVGGQTGKTVARRPGKGWLIAISYERCGQDAIQNVGKTDCLDRELRLPETCSKGSDHCYCVFVIQDLLGSHRLRF
jgi:hypothetical protein